MKHDHKVGDIWYRYEGSYNVFRAGVKLPFPIEYKLVQVTPKTVLIQPVDYSWKNAKRQYIGSNAGFAKPTLELAMESFRVRKMRAIQHFKRKLAEAESEMYIAEKMIREHKMQPELLTFEVEDYLKIEVRHSYSGDY